jgi:hypothetical protein
MARQDRGLAAGEVWNYYFEKRKNENDSCGFGTATYMASDAVFSSTAPRLLRFATGNTEAARQTLERWRRRIEALVAAGYKFSCAADRLKCINCYPSMVRVRGPLRWQCHSYICPWCWGRAAQEVGRHAGLEPAEYRDPGYEGLDSAGLAEKLHQHQIYQFEQIFDLAAIGQTPASLCDFWAERLRIFRAECALATCGRLAASVGWEVLFPGEGKRVSPYYRLRCRALVWLRHARQGQHRPLSESLSPQLLTAPTLREYRQALSWVTAYPRQFLTATPAFVRTVLEARTGDILPPQRTLKGLFRYRKRRPGDGPETPASPEDGLDFRTTGG